MAETSDDEERLPLTEEHIEVDKRTVETGRVRVRTVVDENTHWVRESLVSESVKIAVLRPAIHPGCAGRGLDSAAGALRPARCGHRPSIVSRLPSSSGRGRFRHVQPH